VHAAPKEDLVGRTVCFTGTTQGPRGTSCSRSDAERLAGDHGLVPKPGVSRSLDYLVAANPTGSTGKLKKARQLNVRVMGAREFWMMLGLE
jgi:DNA polymerase-3 subunit epsilon